MSKEVTMETDELMETPVKKAGKKSSPEKKILEIKPKKDDRSQYTATNLNQRQKKLVPLYRAEKKVKVRVAPSYATWLGNVVRVSINGVIVEFPCDGKEREYPETFANEMLGRMSKIDSQVMRQNQMSDIQKNFDGNTPGSKRFF